MKDTQIIRVLDIIFFKHPYIMMPEVTKADAIVAAAQPLTRALQNEIPANIGETNETQLIDWHASS